MSQLSVDDFTALVNTAFTVKHGASSYTLSLVEVDSRAARGPGERAPFSLLFLGPAEPVLPQAMYEFEHRAHAPMTLFIVPVGPQDGQMRYEAVFS